MRRPSSKPAMLPSRWSALVVDPSLPASDPIREGQTLYVARRLACHKLNGAASSDVRRDLNLPLNATEHMTKMGMHALM